MHDLAISWICNEKFATTDWLKHTTTSTRSSKIVNMEDAAPAAEK